jgi:hypothetical protein
MDSPDYPKKWESSDPLPLSDDHQSLLIILSGPMSNPVVIAIVIGRILPETKYF